MASDEVWLNDIQMIIGKESPQLFKTLCNLAETNTVQGSFVRDIQSEILKCMKSCKIFLGEVRASANNYTMHDLQHSINVIELMGQLLVNPLQLSAIEVSCLIFSALLHDIGMVKCGDEKDISLNEIRDKHGERSASFIENEIIRDEAGQPLNFGKHHLIMKRYLPMICASHMQDFSYIDKLPIDLHVDGMRMNVAACAVLLRLADAMDLFQNRAPYSLFKFLHLKGISMDHWKKHLSITDCFIDTNGFYRVDGICDNELAHRALYNHLDMVEMELRSAIVWFSQSKSSIELSTKSNIIKSNINTQGYSIWHHSFSMDFLSISYLFMGEHLYGSREVGLREIIQNAIDACLVREECERKNNKLVFSRYIPCITISSDDSYIYIRDNGIGMSDEVIQKYFLNIGVSYYQSNEYKDMKLSYKPMGFFGIGFLAGFMLSDEIWIKTSSFKENKMYQLHLVKGDKYVAKYSYDKKEFTGTEIKLNKESFIKIFAKNNLFVSKTKEGGLNEVKRFILDYFWKLKIIHEDENYLEFEIIKKNYEECLINEKRNNENEICLSKYLNNIEGCIFFKESNSYKQMWNKSGVKCNSIFKALEDGKIELGGKIKKSIPFCSKSFLFDGNNIHNVEYVSEVPSEYLWILIPQCKSQKTIEQLLNYTMYLTESKIESSLYENKWYSLFVPRDWGEKFNKTIRVTYYGKSFKLFWQDISTFGFIRDLEKRIKSEINYLLICDVNENIAMYQSTFYYDRTIILGGNDFWLKSTKIEEPVLDNDWLMFEEFRYFVNIKNEEISPQASRHYLTESSNRYLSEALLIVKYIWLFEQVKSISCPDRTINYIKERLVELWNAENPLLCSEFKPSL